MRCSGRWTRRLHKARPQDEPPTRELSLRSDAPCYRARRDQSKNSRNEDDLLEDACLWSCSCYDQRQYKECQDDEDRDADQSQHDRTSLLADAGL
jgi:hypothetical protein